MASRKHRIRRRLAPRPRRPPGKVSLRPRPDTEVLVLGEGILFRGDAAVAEPGGDGFDVFDLPSEDGALQRSEIRDLDDANHVTADGHDQRKFIQAYEFESELAFVKSSRFVIVLCGD